MRWISLLLLCSQAFGQTQLSVNLGDRNFSVGLNGSYLGEFSNEIRFDFPSADTNHLYLYGAFDEDTIRIMRTFVVNGKDNYKYRLAEVKDGVYRIRYSGEGTITNAIKIPINQDSTWSWPESTAPGVVLSFGPTNEELRELEKIEIDPIIQTDSALVKTSTAATKNDSVPPNSHSGEIEQLCQLSTEFERLKTARELAIKEKLSEPEIRSLMKCLQFDNSRLLLINDISSFYKTNPWFLELGNEFDFDLSKSQYLEMIK